MLYKNLFPLDYCKLQNKEGFIFKILDQKEKLINKHKKHNNNCIQDKKNEIESIKKEKSKLIEIRDKSNNTPIIILEQEIQKLEIENQRINSKKMKDLISRDNIDEIFFISSKDVLFEKDDYEYIKTHKYLPLLKWFVRNGYIDDTYMDYISYYYDGYMSINDKDFLFSVRNKTKLRYDYKLNNIENVFQYLTIDDFDEKEIINLDLLEYLLTNNNEKTKDYLENFIITLIQNNEYKLFCKHILDGNNHIKDSSNSESVFDFHKFIEKANTKYPNLWADIKNEPKNIENTRVYIALSMYYTDNETLKKMNVDGSLGAYISTSGYHFMLPAYQQPEFINRLIESYECLNVKLKNISSTTNNKYLSKSYLLQRICRKYLYEINIENLEFILKRNIMKYDEYDFRHQNYTFLVRSNQLNLMRYINNNINEYLENVVFNMCNRNITDDEHTVLYILNNSNVYDKNKEQYIIYLTTTIKDVSLVKEYLIREILLYNHKKIEYNEVNIIEYSTGNYLPKYTIPFIDSDLRILNFSNQSLKVREGLYTCFLEKYNLSDKKYKEIFSTLNIRHAYVPRVGIPETKLSILIDEKVIIMNDYTLIGMRSGYSFKKVMRFIEVNINEYTEMMNSVLFDLRELINILDLDVSDENKLKLLKHTKAEISIIGKDYSNAINIYILKNNLKEKDVIELFYNYEKYNFAMRREIENLSSIYMETIIDNILRMPIKLINELIKSPYTDPYTKELLINYSEDAWM